MALLLELLDMLRRGATCAGLIHAATSQHGHHGEHLGAGAKLEDREEVCQVVAQHIARDRDRVQALLGALAGLARGLHRRHDLNVEAAGVVLLQVLLDLADEHHIVRASRVQPEDGLARLVLVREVVLAAAVHGQLDPVLDGVVLGLAGAPDVTSRDTVPKQHLAGALHNADHTILLGFEGGRVRTVLLSLLGHEANIGAGAHGLRVKGAVLLAELDHLVEDCGVAPIRNRRLEILLLVIDVPHLAATANGGGHGVVNDDVARHVQVRDALV
mmetsp:Transcript_117348/g.163313  ORF Transcript_117348/g.163313 Transcript_117348/m.163313 type:complete len:272 (-) Transcript_117348:425-1240(-)